MSMIHANDPLVYKSINIWFVKPICFAAPKLCFANPNGVNRHSRYSVLTERVSNCRCVSEACRLNIKNEIAVASTMTSCSIAAMATKSILRIVLRVIEIFTSAFARKFYEQIVTFIQSRNFELFQQQKYNKKGAKTLKH